ncbi:hypothetical protein BSP36_076 [Bacillus phage BSP36]|uniref:Uncharacterized protein n=1 Tax=Bacillus phage BSP38 TaxID=2283013 RepID=A0A345MJT9_BPBSP|nr:hypothetical protein HWB82_gp239 [Bacillus phage BSP38]AXH71121.1 hypothetical protein BSP38_079 [Bacillus phage BSP38]AYJ75163.1 hypothetical protein BSP36_076 [Bacillus phage BSP36]
MAKKKTDVKSEAVEISEASENIEVQADKQPAPIKPYVHIDTFLKTAIPLYDLSRAQAAGFKVKMAGRHYQRDEQIFMDELKAHLDLK